MTQYENVVSPQDCQALCKGHKECSYFVLNTKDLKCYLKNEISQHLTSYDGLIFGPKQCGKILVRFTMNNIDKLD